MTKQLTPAAGQPLTRLPRQLVTVALLLLSILAALTLNLWDETRAVIAPPSLTERYHSLLADLYQTSTDWQVIHHIEREVNTAALTEPARAAFAAQLWRNYLQAPEEYQGLDYLDSVTALLAEHASDFQSILMERSNYLAAEPPAVDFPGQVSDPHSTADLIALLEALAADLEASRAALAAGTTPADPNAPAGSVNLSALESYQRTLAHARELAARELPYAALAPRYQTIVYESYRRVADDTLVDVSQTILLDRAEDPALRLLAADYLRQYGDRELLVEQLYQLVADAQATGVYVEGEPAEAPLQGAFARGLLEALRHTMLEQTGPTQP